MSFHLWMIGKTKENYLRQGMDAYAKRTARYISVESRVFTALREAARRSPDELKKAESEMIRAQLSSSDHLVLLDEKGKQLTSREFAGLLEKRMVQSSVRTIFLIGGAYGCDPVLKERAQTTLSLSKMTFSHQLIRLIFHEQLYRAASILNGLPYHND